MSESSAAVNAMGRETRYGAVRSRIRVEPKDFL